MRWVDVTLVLCQSYFIVMNVTVERCYCHDPLTAGDTRFLMPETLDFAKQHNPLFLERPRWMQMATCISAYVFLPFYCLLLYVALFDRWASWSALILLFVGCKVNAIAFYHTMEFTSHAPPPNLVPYLATELPYVLSIGLILLQLRRAAVQAGEKPKAS